MTEKERATLRKARKLLKSLASRYEKEHDAGYNESNPPLEALYWLAADAAETIDLLLAKVQTKESQEHH